MTNLINFELVSPERKLVSKAVYMAEIPGDDGSFGAMAGHCALVSSLRAGVVRLHSDDKSEQVSEYFIAGGFADVTADNCTILAEEAIEVKDLDKAKLEQGLSDLTEDLELSVEPEDKKLVQAKIDITKAKLLLLSRDNG